VNIFNIVFISNLKKIIMEGKVVGIYFSKQDQANIRIAAAFENESSAAFIRSIVKDELQQMQINIPEDPNK